MNVLKFDRQGIGEWLSRLAEQRDIYAPTAADDGSAGGEWQLLQEYSMPEIRQGVPEKPVKNFLFPQPETLLEFSTVPGDPEALKPHEPADTGRKNVVFGVRPCDARSIVLNEMPYHNDPYYQANMEKNAIIGMACTAACSTCFCSWTGGSPMGTEGTDVCLTEIDGVFLAQAITDRGEELLEAAGDAASQASDAEKEKLAQLREQAEAGSADIKSPDEALKAKDLMELYNAPFWEEIAERCINCGTCTFLCPTCYCFDIQDETLHGKGRRIRCQDSCMFPLFTLHASGHNPRGQKVQRVRNRFMHKMKYFPDRFGPLSCVGCGRCVRDCPVNIDIREVMRLMLALNQG